MCLDDKGRFGPAGAPWWTQREQPGFCWGSVGVTRTHSTSRGGLTLSPWHPQQRRTCLPWQAGPDPEATPLQMAFHGCCAPAGGHGVGAPQD